LLAYTRVGRSETPLKPVALSGVMQVVMANLEPLIEETRALVSVSSMPEVLGDETVLIQLFQNLVNNALKFRGIAPPVVQVHSQREESVWHITVADNGIGIAPQHHEEIFAPFRRLHAASEYEGSGIGLATCRKIVEQHRGRIWVASNLGQGTTFHITLPDATATMAMSQEENNMEALCAQ
jgi:light-regulated signal transduction histidine kinase (bacteriophytochrome)